MHPLFCPVRVTIPSSGRTVHLLNTACWVVLSSRVKRTVELLLFRRTAAVQSRANADSASVLLAWIIGPEVSWCSS